MIYLNIFITVLFVISLYYSAKNNIKTWIYGLLGNALLCFVLLNDALYMSMAFRIYSVIACGIGLYTWRNKSNTTVKKGNIIYPALICIGLSSILYMVNFTPMAVVDSIGTAIAIVATYLLVKRDVNAWKFWIVSDVIYMCVGSIGYIIMYSGMLLLSIYGLINFNRLYVKSNCRKLLVN